MSLKRSSGLDFSDGRAPALDAHPDVYLGDANGGRSLQRNKTERRRLQGLMRTDSMTGGGSAHVDPTNIKLLKLKERWDHWMVNDGKQINFGV